MTFFKFDETKEYFSFLCEIPTLPKRAIINVKRRVARLKRK